MLMFFVNSGSDVVLEPLSLAALAGRRLALTWPLLSNAMFLIGSTQNGAESPDGVWVPPPDPPLSVAIQVVSGDPGHEDNVMVIGQRLASGGPLA
jgi:hypothetical protein